MKKLKILILTLTLTLISSEKNENETFNTTLAIPYANSTISPEELICSRINTCQYSIPEQFDNLKTRTCMCDERCSLHNDCCHDSKYYNANLQNEKKFACLETPFDGYVYMIDNCPSDHNVTEQIVKNCQTVEEIELVSDFLLTMPVTSSKTDITYRNVFCAFCNNETEYKFWDVVVHYDPVMQNSSTPLDKSAYLEVNYYSVLAHLTVDAIRRVLVSKTESATYECDIRANLPSNVPTRACRPNSNDRQCSVCDRLSSTNNSCVNSTISLANLFKVDLKDVNLPKANHCNYVPDTADKELFCAIDIKKQAASVPAEVEDDSGQCFFQTPDGRLCLINSFFEEGTDFEYVDNATVFVRKYNANFSHEEWTNDTTMENGIYVCGTKIPQTDEETVYAAINDLITVILVKFSILFLVVYLWNSANKQQLQSLPNKIIFSFCLNLLAVYTVFEVEQWLPNCHIAAAVTHYLFLSCFAWALIASYDLWQAICRSSNKFQTLAGRTRLKRYLVYCFLGWISPLSIMAVAVYFELALNSTVPCPLKPGYGRLTQCFIAQPKPLYYFFYYPTAIMFTLIITFFVHASYHIYQSKRKNIRSTAQNNYYVLFAKLTLTITPLLGLMWTLGLLVTYGYTNFSIFRFVYVIFNSFQGTFMLFAYGFKSSMLTKAYVKLRDSWIVQRTRSTFVSISGIIKRCPLSQTSTAKADPLTTQEAEHYNTQSSPNLLFFFFFFFFFFNFFLGTPVSNLLELGEFTPNKGQLVPIHTSQFECEKHTS